MIRRLITGGAALVATVFLGAAASTPTAACANGDCLPSYCQCEDQCSFYYERNSGEWQTCRQGCPDYVVDCVCFDD